MGASRHTVSSRGQVALTFAIGDSPKTRLNVERGRLEKLKEMNGLVTCVDNLLCCPWFVGSIAKLRLELHTVDFRRSEAQSITGN